METFLGNFDRDDAYKTLDTINMWIENCDNKASIILGSIGVIASIILSSDFAKIIKDIIETSIINIGWCNGIYIFIFMSAVIICIIGLGCLISCITPRIVTNTSISDRIQKNICKKQHKFKNTQIKNNMQDSIMFYGIVALTQYEQYLEKVKPICKDYDNIMIDLLFQIHSAAVICESKFKKLQKGIVCFLIGFIICFIQIIVGYYTILK